MVSEVSQMRGYNTDGGSNEPKEQQDMCFTAKPLGVQFNELDELIKKVQSVFVSFKIPQKSYEKELNNFFSQIDKRIKEELKKNYREEYSKRKISADNEYSFEIEDDGSSFFTRNIDMKPKTEITQYFNKKGELYMISSLTGEADKELYALYRK